MPATASLPQTLTPFHAKYYAYELTRRCPPDSDDRLASALVDAQADLNPHRIDAALFSFKRQEASTSIHELIARRVIPTNGGRQSHPLLSRHVR